MRACPLVQRNKAAYCKQKAEKMVTDSARGCQMVPESAQRVPEGTR